MFIRLYIEDKIQLHPTITEKEKKIRELITNKYINKPIDNCSIFIGVLDLKNISQYEIVNGYLVANVKFTAIFYRFFESEVVTGKIIKQEEDSIVVSLPFYKNIVIKSQNFPSDCDKTYVMPKGGSKKCIIWYWIYNNTKYYFRNNETVRLRVIDFESNPPGVYGSFAETGLGPMEWWV